MPRDVRLLLSLRDQGCGGPHTSVLTPGQALEIILETGSLLSELDSRTVFSQTEQTSCLGCGGWNSHTHADTRVRTFWTSGLPCCVDGVLGPGLFQKAPDSCPLSCDGVTHPPVAPTALGVASCPPRWGHALHSWELEWGLCEAIHPYSSVTSPGRPLHPVT